MDCDTISPQWKAAMKSVYTVPATVTPARPTYTITLYVRAALPFAHGNFQMRRTFDNEIDAVHTYNQLCDALAPILATHSTLSLDVQDGEYHECLLVSSE